MGKTGRRELNRRGRRSRRDKKVRRTPPRVVEADLNAGNKHFYRSCFIKKKYRTYEHAEKDASKLKIRVYRCKYCDHYHVGH